MASLTVTWRSFPWVGVGNGGSPCREPIRTSRARLGRPEIGALGDRVPNPVAATLKRLDKLAEHGPPPEPQKLRNVLHRYDIGANIGDKAGEILQQPPFRIFETSVVAALGVFGEGLAGSAADEHACVPVGEAAQELLRPDRRHIPTHERRVVVLLERVPADLVDVEAACNVEPFKEEAV